MNINTDLFLTSEKDVNMNIIFFKWWRMNSIDNYFFKKIKAYFYLYYYIGLSKNKSDAELSFENNRKNSN
jgi:hypothetical protein